MKFIHYFLLCLILTIFSTQPIYAHKEGVDKCLTAGFWIEDTVYDFFDPAKNPESHNTFEQWAERQMIAWSKILEKSGAKDCFTVGKIVRVRDHTLSFTPDINDRSVDVQIGFTTEPFFFWEFSPFYNKDPKYKKKVDEALNGISSKLLHELSHARYLIDEYAIDVVVPRDTVQVTDSMNNSVLGTYFKPIKENFLGTYYYENKTGGLMGWGQNSYTYGVHSVGALNLIAGRHTADTYGNDSPPGNYGTYLNDLPKNNSLRILDRNNSPISQANIKVFQSVAGRGGPYTVYSQYGKTIDNIPDIFGVTDGNGEISIGHNPFGGEKIDTRYLSNAIFILEILKNTLVDYQFIEVSDFNLAYWAGATEQATYEIKTNLSPLATPTPTPILTPTPTPVVIPLPTAVPNNIVSPALLPTIAFTPTPTLVFQTPTSKPNFIFNTPAPFQRVTDIVYPTLTIPPTAIQQIPTLASQQQQKTIISITINGVAIDINNPLASIHLPGLEGQESQFIVPIFISYSDGTSKQITLVFDYKPIIAQPTISTPTIIPSPSVSQCVQRYGDDCGFNLEGFIDCDGRCVLPTPSPTIAIPTPAPKVLFDCSGTKQGFTYKCYLQSCPSPYTYSGYNNSGTTCDPADDPEYDAVCCVSYGNPSSPTSTPTSQNNCSNYSSYINCVNDTKCDWEMEDEFCYDK